MDKTPLSDDFADLVTSNCVINLCPDKNAVYEEAFRILRSSGRIAISDIVLTEKIAPELRERFQSTWAGCLGGVIPEGDYWQTMRETGFAENQIVARHLVTPEELEVMACRPGEEVTPPPSKEARAAGKVGLLAVRRAWLPPASQIRQR